VLDDAQRAVVASGDSLSKQPKMSNQTLIRQIPAVRDLFEAIESPTVGGGMPTCVASTSTASSC